MSKYLETNSVERNIGQNRKASLQKIGVSSGKRFQYTSADEGKVTVSFLVRRDMVAKRREIAGLLSSNEPQQLIFGDEPDKYYLAIADGQISLSEKFRHGNGEVTFIIPDGLAHSLTTATVSGQSGTDITVTNAGTAPTSPLLTATMAADNGLVGWVNSAGGVLQFGSPDEIDGTQHDDSETVFHHTMLGAPTGITLNAGTVVYKNYLGDAARPNKQAGSFQYAKDTAAPMYNRTASDNWAGPSMSGTIAANSQGSNMGNLLWANRINLATNAQAAGRIEFNLTSSSNIVLSMVLRDSNYASDILTLDLIAMGQTIWSHNLDRKLFTNGFYSLQIGKLGNQATFRLAKIQTLEGGMNTGQTLVQSPTIVGLADAAIDGYTVWMPGFSDKPGWTINWSDSIFQWVNVEYWQDLPNRFSAGDELVADVATKTVYVNGVEDGTVQAIGNDWDKFMIQPGENTLQPVASSWAEPFTAKIEYREAWL